MTSRPFILATVTLASIMLLAAPARALNTVTHRLINEAAANSEDFDILLRAHLGFLRGLDEPLLVPYSVVPYSVLGWIGEGGDREDDGIRWLRHFHNPLHPWSTAGLSVAGVQFDSSIRWMQRGDDAQPWSWPAARRLYWKALTTVEPSDRNARWVDTFRALGQVMHLVVDASVPEHTRHDIHPLEGLCREVGLRCLGSYEYWVSDAQKHDTYTFFLEYLSSPIGFDPRILQEPTGDPVARVPIARLIDTDTYSGADPNVTLGPAIGLAEVSHANFFSEDTGGNTHPFPSLARLEPSRLPAPRTGRTRAYFSKGYADGLDVNPVLAECVLYQPTADGGVVEPVSYTCADENVWRATARRMLPRAVGYARGAIDYFFRGRIEIAAPDRYVYGLAPSDPAGNGRFTRLRFKVRNATPGEDTGPGELVAVVRHRLPANNESLIEKPHAPLRPEPSFAVSRPVAVTLTPSFQEVVLDFPDHPIPTNSADIFLTVAYRARLGLEDDAILVGGKKLFEPDPLDDSNITDWDCHGGQTYQVDILPAFNPPGETRRDPSGDGIPDLFGPWVERDHFIKTFDLDGPVPFPSPADFDLMVPGRSYAQYTRVFILQDQGHYGVAALTRQVQEIPTGLTLTDLGGLVRMEAVYNYLALGPDREPVRYTLPSGVSRGIRRFHGIVLANPGMAWCMDLVPGLEPPLMEIDGVLPLD
jgi:hypothetical protein